jgi:hypothetical protein
VRAALNRIHLVLFGMRSRTFGPYLAAMHRILISLLRLQVAVCPGGIPTGYTYFIPSEEHLESRIVTRGFMEGKLVVSMAGRCAERLVCGDANVTTAGAATRAPVACKGVSPNPKP